MPFSLAALLLLASPALADERYDHRGSLGLLLGGGVAIKDEVIAGQVEDGVRIPAQLGATLAVGDVGNELVLDSVTTFRGPHVDWGAAFGYRGYFGQEQVKTFLMLELCAHFQPQLTVGPRATFGVQYELWPTVGVFAALAADLGYGAGLRFSAEALAGVQLRSYLLE
jgi:hypothetical protein